MPELTLTASRPSAYRGAGLAALALLALTSVHHVYGAIAFGTPWRMHILLAAIPAAIVIVAGLSIGERNRGTMLGQVLTWIAALVILAFPVALIGFYEGGYNHVLKNVVFLLFGEARTLAMFPPPTYELPTDLVFEMTGIAQFPLAVLTAICVWRLVGAR